jgi:hypothetical protein
MNSSVYFQSISSPVYKYKSWADWSDDESDFLPVQSVSANTMSGNSLDVFPSCPIKYSAPDTTFAPILPASPSLPQVEEKVAKRKKSRKARKPKQVEQLSPNVSHAPKSLEEMYGDVELRIESVTPTSMISLSETERSMCESPADAVYEYRCLETPVSVEDDTWRTDLLSTLRPDLKPSDTLGSLRLYKEEHLTRDSSDSLKAIRGIITDGTTLLVKAFPYTSQVCREDEDFDQVITSNLHTDSDIYYTYDGSMVRLWYYPEERAWKISTVSKIDAFKAKWNSTETFGQKFIELQEFQTHMSFDVFCNTHLSPSMVYVFLITTDPNTRYICYNDQPRLYVLGSFDRSRHFDYTRCSFENVGIPTPPSPPSFELQTIRSEGPIGIVRMLEDSKNTNVQEYKVEGYTIINPRNGNLIKVCSMKFKDAIRLRGKDPCKYIGYFYHFQKESAKPYVQTLYSSLAANFSYLDDALHQYVKKVVYLYNHYQSQDTSRHAKIVARTVHAIYEIYKDELQNTKRHTITPEDVITYLHDTVSVRDPKSYNFKMDLFTFANALIKKKHDKEIRMLEDSMKPTMPLAPKKITHVYFGKRRVKLAESEQEVIMRHSDLFHIKK